MGAGVKIAIIDAGVFTPHPTFNPAGFAFPPGFPKGETSATNAKVIAARAYFRPNHPPQPGHESPVPPPNGNGHGTHVASIAAGNPVIASVAGVETPFSGVAPGAYLMNYRIFYPSQAPVERFRQESAFTVETLAAIEDAVRDGADVINNSWGSRSLAYNWPNPTVRALENAVMAGVVVVNSAGNAGPGSSTVGSGASSPLVIAVGMVTTNSELARDFVLTPGAPEGVARLRMTPAAFGPRLTGPTPARPIAIVPPFALPAPAACAPLAPNSLAGNVAIIARGGCTFVEKAINAQNAGAEGVIFVNNEDERLTAASTDLGGQVRIPAVTISRSDGRRLVDWFEANGGARVQLDPSSAFIPVRPDVLSQGSSRGPALEPVLKPDLVAPGVEILAAGFGPAPNGVRGFGPATGTSMAAPHVSGAAAIMRQLRPDWSPLQIKAALMSTADTNVRVGPGWLAGPLDRGAGRIDLARALDPAIMASPPGLSFGETTAGRTLTQQARVTALQRGYYRVSVNLTGFNVPGARPIVQVTPREFALDPNTFVDLTVQITLPASLPPSDHQGDIQLVVDG
ncbi:MAG: S8 family serine peptidase, partial [Dehalococcoidia bacterium]|nr:S8 family serine peptidase [Dehalococcoidia bacterium]